MVYAPSFFGGGYPSAGGNAGMFSNANVLSPYGLNPNGPKGANVGEATSLSAGAGALGGLITGLGQQEGADALAQATQAQMTQQQGIQNQANQAMGNFLGNNQPAQTQSTATSQFEQPAQQYLQKLQGYKPAGLSGAGANAFQTASSGSQADLQAANARLARQQGSQQAQSLQQQGGQNLQSQIGDLQLQNQRNQQMYGIQNAQAANKGSGLRFLGGLTSAAGQAAGGLAMM